MTFRSAKGRTEHRLDAHDYIDDPVRRELIVRVRRTFVRGGMCDSAGAWRIFLATLPKRTTA